LTVWPLPIRKTAFANSSGSSKVEAGKDRCERFFFSAVSAFEGVSSLEDFVSFAPFATSISARDQNMNMDRIGGAFKSPSNDVFYRPAMWSLGFARTLSYFRRKRRLGSAACASSGSSIGKGICGGGLPPTIPIGGNGRCLRSVFTGLVAL
jgi:hypothetical protein